MTGSMLTRPVLKGGQLSCERFVHIVPVDVMCVMGKLTLAVPILFDSRDMHNLANGCVDVVGDFPITVEEGTRFTLDVGLLG